VGPACQLHPLPQAGRPLPLLLIAFGHLVPPGLQPRDAKQGVHSPPGFPLLISLLNPSSSRPTINGVKAITADHFPLPRPGMPLPCHYKRVRSTPRPSPHSPRPHLLAPESATSTPPSASSAGCSPSFPGRVRPSAAPLVAGEAHRPYTAAIYHLKIANDVFNGHMDCSILSPCHVAPMRGMAPCCRAA
jgi:hypothetical protein